MNLARSRLRVLVLANEAPWPLNHGGRLRLFHLASELATRSEVTVYAARADEQALHALSRAPFTTIAHDTCASCGTLPQRGWISLRARLRRYYGYDPTLADRFAHLSGTGGFDVVLLSGARAGLYAHDVKIPAVWDLVDDQVLYHARGLPQSRLNQVPTSLRSLGLAALYQRDCGSACVATTVASEPDATWLRSWCGLRSVAVVTNGVDAQQFPELGPSGDAHAVLFVGAMDFPPNVQAATWFAQEVWPAVQARDPRRRFDIVGRAAAQLSLTNAPRAIAVHSDVLDLRSYLERAAVVVVPTWLGGGVKNKILEAAASRRAVLTTPTALNGLSARPNVDIGVAHDRNQWITSLDALLSEPQRRTSLADAGHAWVRSAHQWSREADRLRDVLHRAHARHRGNRTDDSGPMLEGATSVDERSLLKNQPSTKPAAVEPEVFACR